MKSGHDIISLAEEVDKKYDEYVFLFSGVTNNFGAKSFLAYETCEVYTNKTLEEMICVQKENPVNMLYYGFFGHNVLSKQKYSIPQSFWCTFRKEVEFINTKNKEENKSFANLFSKQNNKVLSIKTNFSDEEFVEKVLQIKEYIQCGRIFQANLTRKFCVEFNKKINAFSVFKNICYTSPSCYSAIVKVSNGRYVVSSSPERFIKINESGTMFASPIKGTIKRIPGDSVDIDYLRSFANNEKQMSENLMITDLMRNDIGISAEIGSVSVDSLFDVTTHKTLHHLSSNVSGQKRKDVMALEVLAKAMPVGSMTGAPKYEATKVCCEIEPNDRGIYSGFIGYFNKDICDASVIIRTMIIEDNKLEFQVGCGIVADSQPNEELSEMYIKALGICNAIEVEIGELKSATVAW